ncbi:MAG: hypothetical protein Q8P68_00070 [Candidatus Peregrinibacteria bacterium]|nr:hypothetical protein [Candidatus Peregrinibacteria bacterium]MDZ4244909.1 hypothetical protein [Candidatus Gracilibacteria bacterium]
MKKIFQKLVEFISKNRAYVVILATALIASYFVDIHTVFAQDADVSKFVEDIGKDAGLYNPVEDAEAHRRALDIEGISTIQTIIFQIVDVSKYMLGSAAVLIMTILGIRLTVSSKSEEAITQAKTHFTYLLIGFVLIMVADYFVANVLYGAEGEVLATSESAQFFASQGSLELKRIYTFIEAFVGAIAVLVIIVNGFRMVMSAGEEIDEQKKAIMWAVVGLVIIGLSEVVIKEIIFAEKGSTINIKGGIDIIITLTNFITGFVSFLSVALIVYAGVQYVIAFVSEGSDEKGKKALIAAVIGILIVAGSYGLTATMIAFKG